MRKGCIAHRELKESAEKYDVSYHIVLACLPGKVDEFSTNDYSNTILPNGIESVLRRFAITYRNKWMVNKFNYIVTYVTNHIGSGAAQFKEPAERKGKGVINIA